MNNAELGWTVTQVPFDWTPIIILILFAAFIVIFKEFVQWRIRIDNFNHRPVTFAELFLSKREDNNE